MLTFEQLLARQAELTSSIANAIPNLKKVGVANYSHSNITARLNVVEKNWKEFTENHLLICAFRCKDNADEKYFTTNDYSSTEEEYLLAISYLYTSLEKLPATATLPAALAAASSNTTTVKQLPRIDLPKFSGNFTDWVDFRDLFVSMVSSNQSLTNVERLHYLKTSMTGEASQLLKNIATTGESFDRAWNILTARFENKRLLVSSHLSALTSLPPVTCESASQLKRLINGTTNSRGALEQLKRPVGSWDDLLFHLTVQKLDHATRREWETLIGAKTEFPTFTELETFINTRINTLEALGAQQKSSRSTQQSDRSHFDNSNKSGSAKVHHTTNARESVCSLCSAAHFIMNCPEFRSKTPEERRQIVTKKNLCFNCLGSHRISECRNTKRCIQCTGHHHTMLHSTSPLPMTSTSHQATTWTSITPRTLPRAFVSQQAAAPGNSVLLATALVHVHDHQGKRQLARALIDQGSEASFISDTMVRKVKLSRNSVHVPITGIGGVRATSAQGRTDIKLSSRVDPRFSINVDTLILPKVSEYQPSVQTVLADWTHLEGTKLADSYEAFQTPIDLILGAEVYAAILHEGIRRGPPGTPVAQQTALGWILSGPLSATKSTPTAAVISSHLHYANATSSHRTASLTAGGISPSQHFSISSYDEAGGMFATNAPLSRL